MIIVTMSGGLGNQMFRYAMGHALADRRRVPLRVDLRAYAVSHPSVTPRKFELGRFQVDCAPISLFDKLCLAASGLYGTRKWVRRLAPCLPLPRFAHVAEGRNGYDPRTAAGAPENAFVEGDWQCERYFAHVRDDLLSAFRFRSEPSPENAAMLERIRAAAPAVCVHVRRSDYLVPGQLTQALPPDYYVRALGWMGEQVPGGRYFAFSDDPAWARANLPWPDGTTFVTHNTGRDDAEDLRLMTACDHFVIANSTFSWWAAWLGRRADKRVIAPQRWFAVAHGSEADVVPDRWVRL